MFKKILLFVSKILRFLLGIALLAFVSIKFLILALNLILQENLELPIYYFLFSVMLLTWIFGFLTSFDSKWFNPYLKTFAKILIAISGFIVGSLGILLTASLQFIFYYLPKGILWDLTTKPILKVFFPLQMQRREYTKEQSILEQDRVRKISKEELTDEVKIVLNFRKNFLENNTFSKEEWSGDFLLDVVRMIPSGGNIPKSLYCFEITPETGTETIKDLKCNFCDNETEYFLHESFKQMVKANPSESANVMSKSEPKHFKRYFCSLCFLYEEIECEEEKKEVSKRAREIGINLPIC